MKILIVEDDKIMSDNLEALLKPEGYEVVVASDGIDALKMIIDTQPDLIITDILMPNLSGLELLKRLKDENDLEDLTDKAFPQKRLLDNSPLVPDRVQLKELFRDSMSYW